MIFNSFHSIFLMERKRLAPKNTAPESPSVPNEKSVASKTATENRVAPNEKKRLAPKNTAPESPSVLNEKKRVAPQVETKKESSTEKTHSDINIFPYTEKSFIITGETLNHSEALTALGGKYCVSLKNYSGGAWLFAKYKEASVKKYIDTGVIEQAVYNGPVKSQSSDYSKVFRELKDAFDPDETYEGSAIFSIIHQLEKKFV